MIPYLVHLTVLAALVGLLYQRSARAPLRKLFFYALPAKLLAGIALGLLYTHYYPYPSDTFLFFADARLLARLAGDSPEAYARVLLFDRFPDARLPAALVYGSESRSFFFVKTLSLLNVATANSYWLASLYLSLFSFWGLWRAANALALRFPGTHRAAALGFLFFPSVVFWSSGVLKESLVMGAIGGLTAAGLTCVGEAKKPPRSWHPRQGFLVGLALVVLWKLKYHYFVAFVACAAAGGGAILVCRRLRVESRWAKIGVWLLGFVGLASLGTLLHYNLHLANFLAVLVQNHDTIYALSAPENRIEFNHLTPDPVSLLRNLPVALLSGLFRPLVWEGRTLPQWLTGTENLFLLGLTGIAGYRFGKGQAFGPAPFSFLPAFTAGAYILLLATTLAFSTPNFGTLARYKVAFLPFFVYLLAVGAARNHDE
ncbi:MAG: hypothetical protein H7Z75_19515 [Ferruginibacter sp.]|nr:hypothetical protein [Cytophagales bacterium]